MTPTTIDVGSRLRHAREQRGLTHRDVATMTKLSTSTLKAIEQNEFGRLPGGMFRVAYIRTVAASVGLDSEELVRAYRRAVEAETPAIPAATGARNPLRPPVGWTSWAVLVGAATGAIWLGAPDDGARREAPLEASRLWSQKTTLPLAVAEAARTVASVPATDTTTPSLQLELHVKAVCWVSLVADGERLIYRLMQPGEHTLVEAQEAITLRLGDASAVAYSVNGVAGGSLGGDGEVATLRITEHGTESS